MKNTKVSSHPRAHREGRLVEQILRQLVGRTLPSCRGPRRTNSSPARDSSRRMRVRESQKEDLAQVVGLARAHPFHAAGVVEVAEGGPSRERRVVDIT